MTKLKPATRHECIHRGQLGYGVHDSGSGQPKRKKCRYCGGGFSILTGWYCVFVWRGDGRYRIEDAVSVHNRESLADTAASRDSSHVVRWIGA